MTIKQIKDGLHFTMDMFLFDPSTGEYKNKEQLNDMDRTTYDACEGAIEALEQEPIIDKIRAEILSKDGLEEALEIIDKYKAEGIGEK